MPQFGKKVKKDISVVFCRANPSSVGSCLLYTLFRSCKTICYEPFSSDYIFPASSYFERDIAKQFSKIAA